MLLDPRHIDDAQIVIKVFAAHIAKNHEVGWQEVIPLGEDQFIIRKSDEHELMIYRIIPDAIIKTSVKPKPTQVPDIGTVNPFQSVGLRERDPQTGEWYNTKDRERMTNVTLDQNGFPHKRKGLTQRIVEYFGDF